MSNDPYLMEDDLLDRLIAKTPLRNLLADDGGDPAIHLVSRPDDGPTPCIVAYPISPGVHYDQENRTELEIPLIQFTIMAGSYLEALAIRAALEEIMETPETVGDTAFGPGHLEGRRSLRALDLDGGQRVFPLALDFRMSHHRVSSQ